MARRGAPGGSSEPTLFVVLLLTGFLALGPLQWGNIALPFGLLPIYKVVTPVLLLGATVALFRSPRFRRYGRVSFAFFVGSTAFLLLWLVAQFLTYPGTTVEGIALGKARDALLVVVVIVAAVRVSGHQMSSVYYQRGKLRLGLVVGLSTFVGFALVGIPGATWLFAAQNLGLGTVLSWTPWILIFALASGTLEESLYRGLFLRRYASLLGPRTANLLQAAIFATIHLGVAYTPEPYLFVALTLGLGLVWGFLMQKSESVLGSVLFHAGTDVLVILGIFSGL